MSFKGVVKSLLPSSLVSFLRTERILLSRRRANRLPVNLYCSTAIHEATEPGEHVFFGYYDLSPLDMSDKRLLAGRVASTSSANQSMKVGWYQVANDGSVGSFNALAETKAWCWQQGCRLQWMPKSEDSLVFFNSHHSGHHAGCIVDAETGQTQSVLPRAIYSMSLDGRWGVSLNFSRLQRLRPGYGYGDLPDESIGQHAPSGDGLWLIEVGSGDCRLILSLLQASEFESHPSMAGAEHYFNHVAWGPNSDRFMVFHIWQSSDGRRRIRALSVDTNGKLRCITNENHVSHYWWMSQDEMLFYNTPPDQSSGYYLYKDDGSCVPVRSYAGLLPEGDGHPSYSTTAGLIVTDTLPDRFSERGLYLFDPEKESLTEIGSFFSPPKMFGETRCDLHPRWSPSGNKVVIDSAHNSYRSMAIIDTSKVIEMTKHV